jgi:hypothetical protein
MNRYQSNGFQTTINKTSMDLTGSISHPHGNSPNQNSKFLKGHDIIPNAQTKTFNLT